MTTLNVDRVVKGTDDALLFEIDGDRTWVPRSVIEDDDSIDIGTVDIEVNVKTWFAKKEGLV